MAHEGKGTFFTMVDQDRIWARNVRRTTNNQLFIWPNRWSFLVEEYRKMNEALEGKRVLSPYDWSRQYKPKPPEKQPKKKKRKEGPRIYLPPIGQVPSKSASKALPMTSSGWYGFWPTVDGRNLVSERQEWIKANAFQHNLVKVLKWPLDYWD